MTDDTKPVFKFFSIKGAEAELEGNRFRGVPSVLGNLDEGQDVIAPGAFKSAIDGFLSSGFVPIGHDWYDLPVAMPVSAREEGNKLIAEAEFHSTPRAQEARTIMQERLAKNLDVGLSIGFDIAPGGAEIFEDGEKMLEHLKATKAETSLFDVDGIKACKGLCRLITNIRKLFEFSIVSVPMNPLAVATTAKVYATYDFDALQDERAVEAFLREVGLSKTAAIKFISTFKGIVLPRRDAAGDEPVPDSEVDASSETPEVKTDEPVVTPIISPKPLLFASDGRIIPCLP